MYSYNLTMSLIACCALLAGIAIGKRRARAPAEGRAAFDTIVVQIELARVFVLRIWLGRALLKLSMWVIGGRASVLELPD